MHHGLFTDIVVRATVLCGGVNSPCVPYYPQSQSTSQDLSSPPTWL